MLTAKEARKRFLDAHQEQDNEEVENILQDVLSKISEKCEEGNAIGYQLPGNPPTSTILLVKKKLECLGYTVDERVFYYTLVVRW